MNTIVVHYKELALKGKNRPWFIRLLVRNLRVALGDLDIRSIRSVMGRIEIELGPEAAWDDVRDRVRRVFGIANFSYAGRASHDFDALAAAILADLGDLDPPSFRVRARRSDKRFPFTSPQIEREVGGRIKEAKGWRVDLDDAALTIHLEMMPDHAFYYFGKEPGAGGLPTGTGGRVACLLSGGIDSPVAAYRMMRRGCSVLLVHFHSYPILSRASQEKGPRDRRAAHEAPAPIAAGARALRRAAAAGPARRPRRAARRHLPPPDDAHRREARAALAGPRAGDRRGHRPGRLPDAREHDQHRRGDDDGGAEAAGGNGQG